MHKGVLLLLLVGVCYVAGVSFVSKLKSKIKKPKQKQGDETDLAYSYDEDQPCGEFDITTTDLQKLQEEHQLEVKELPWIVYLVYHDGRNYIPTCLGSLLPDADEESTTIVLTEKTCIHNRNELKDYYIYTGKDIQITDQSRLFPIEEVAIDGTKANPMDHNAMVITTQDEIYLDAHHKVVCLPKLMETPKKDAKCVSTSIRPGSKGPELTLFDVRYMEPKECKRQSSDVYDMDSKVEACGWDRRQGSMLARGGSMLCQEDGKWVQYGVESHAGHIIHGYESRYYLDTVRTEEKPSIFIDVGKFWKLMAESKSLMKYSRINLMSMR